MIVDTHCHLHQYADSCRVVADCVESGIAVHVVTVSPTEFDAVVRMSERGDCFRPSLGLYPDDIGLREREWPAFAELLPRVPLIGEVGLDYVTEDLDERRRQRALFERILAASAEAGGRFLSIHSRRASADVLAMLAGGVPGSAVLHWFSGRVDEIEQAPESVWFSVNPAMAVSRRGRALVGAMDRGRVLLETDGPWVRVGDRPAEPRDLPLVLDFLAGVWGGTADEAAAQVARNFSRAVRNIPGLCALTGD